MLKMADLDYHIKSGQMKKSAWKDYCIISKANKKLEGLFYAKFKLS